MYNRQTVRPLLPGLILLVGCALPGPIKAATPEETPSKSHAAASKPTPGTKGAVNPQDRGATGQVSETKSSSQETSTDELRLLKERVARQQEEIDQLREMLEDQKRSPQQAMESGTERTPSPGSAHLASLGETVSTSPILPAAPSKTASASVRADPIAAALPKSNPPQSNQPAEGQKSPLSFKIGDADFTPGGFMDFTTVFRSTNLGSGIGTSFGGIPFSRTPAGSLTETRLSMQNSRLSLGVTSKVSGFDIKGYVEADFLGNAPPNVFVTSNANTFRSRLYWVQARKSKFEFLGGQSWTLLTPNRTGLSPVPSDLFFTQNMDTNYQVGLTWARQAGVRFVYHPTDQWAAGFAIENPQQFVGSASLPSAFSASEVETGSGNTATPNLHPDIIAKVAYDPMVGGLHQHVEVAGLLTSVRVFDSVSNTKNAATGGGVSANFNFEVVKNLHAILNTFYSDGGGRYIFGLGPQFVVRPDSSRALAPVLLHSGSGIVGFEYQINKPTLLYGYYGGAYFGRYTSVDPANGRLIGYGFSGSPNSQNRAIQEGTFGIIQTFWKNPRYGALQLITQYSYLTRSPWAVASGQPKNAHLSMGFADIRYVLP